MLSLEYVAGLFDGEGFVYIFKKVRGKHVGYYLSTGINMCHRPIIEELYSQFGGHINGGSRRSNPKHRNIFAWGLANQLAADFLIQIRSHVRVKGPEIDLGLELQQHINKISYPKKEQREEVRAYREDLFQRCKLLKTTAFESIPRKFEEGRFGRPSKS